MTRSTQFPEPPTPLPEHMVRDYTEEERAFITQDILANPDHIDAYHQARLDRFVATQWIDCRRYIDAIVHHPRAEQHFRGLLAVGKKALQEFSDYYYEQYGIVASANLEQRWGPNSTERFVLSRDPEIRNVGMTMLRGEYAGGIESFSFDGMPPPGEHAKSEEPDLVAS